MTPGLTSWRQATPIGDLIVVLGPAGVVRIRLPAGPGESPLDAEPERDDRVAGELDEYFAGTRRTFETPVDLAGSNDLSVRVLGVLRREVPWGETVTYGELADMVGAPRAARAVGNVMARNPVPILVPCHRVVAAGGRIGGYGPAGVPVKRALLAIEGVEVS